MSSLFYETQACYKKVKSVVKEVTNHKRHKFMVATSAVYNMKHKYYYFKSP